MSDETSNSSDTSNNDSFNTPDQEDEDLFDDVKEARKEEAAKPKAPVKAQVKPQAKPEGKEQDTKEEKAAKQYYKAVINGKEESVDHETLIREYQKGRAGDERLSKAQAIEKQTQAFIQALRDDPEKVLSNPNLGINKRELAMKILQAQIEEETADPKEVEYRSQAEELKAYKEREQRQKEDQEEKEHTEKHTKAVQARRQELGDTFAKAMELSPLSKDPETAASALREMAIAYRLAKQSGYEATPEELAAHVEQQQFKKMYSAASTLSGEDLLGFLGEAVVNKIRKADLARIQGRLGGGQSPTQTSNWNSSPSPKSDGKTIDPSDFRMKLRDNK